MKILGGVYPHPQYGGENFHRRQTAAIQSECAMPKKAGIAVIYQELSLVREMTVGENIFSGTRAQ
jgi:D-xylose transport system ATP-binding protein